MPPIILVLLQGLFLLLLYLFLARAVRAVVRDIRTSAAPPRAAPPRAGARPAGARSGARQPAPSQRRASRRQPSELVVHTPGGKPRVVALDSEEVRFGRSQQCTVPIEDSYVSEQPAAHLRTSTTVLPMASWSPGCSGAGEVTVLFQLGDLPCCPRIWRRHVKTSGQVTASSL
jgi:hypothetical protein